MHRRGLLALGIPFGLALAGSTAAQAEPSRRHRPPVRRPRTPFSSRTTPSSGSRRCAPLARPSMAAAGSARCWRPRPVSSPATTTAGTTPGTRPATASPRGSDAASFAKGHRISARDSFLRASSAYRSSEFFLHGNPTDPRIARAYKLSVDRYKRLRGAVRPADLAGRDPVRADDLAGLFPPGGRFEPPASDHRHAHRLRRLGGGDARLRRASGGGARLQCPGVRRPRPVRPAAPRGPRVFRPDWEKVVTPVVDFTLAAARRRSAQARPLRRQSRRRARATRAAAFEHRFAALIANDGVYDFAAPALAAVPPLMMGAFLHMLKADSAPPIDHGLANAMKTSPTARWAITHGMWATGAATPSRIPGQEPGL